MLSSPIKSAVLKPLASTLFTALFIRSDSLSILNEYFKHIAKLRIDAIGFAIPLPAMSGAEPWTGSYKDFLKLLLSTAPKEAEGNIPSEPVSIAASSDRMSPNKLSVTITSNCLGFLTNCIAQLSAYI